MDDKFRNYISDIECAQNNSEVAIQSGNVADEQRYQSEITRLLELCTYAEKPKDGWVEQKRREVAQRLDAAMRDLDLAQQALKATSDQPRPDVAILTGYQRDQARGYRAAERARQLLSVL